MSEFDRVGVALFIYASMWNSVEGRLQRGSGKETMRKSYQIPLRKLKASNLTLLSRLFEVTF